VNKFTYVRNWPSKLTASLMTYYSDVNNDYLLFADRNIYCNELLKAIKSFNVIVNTICDIERYVANFASVCDQICDGRTCDLFRE